MSNDYLVASSITISRIDQITGTYILILRIAGGKIVENWDDIGLQKDFEQFFPSESAGIPMNLQ
jgi:hypothetical protein